MKKELLAILEGHEDDWESFVEDLDWRPEEHEMFKVLTDAGFLVKGEEQHGGEGQGEDYYIVFSVTRGEEKKYFMLQGWYASYDGHHFDGGYTDFDEVEPIQVTVRQWKAVE
jgi:hypothetical protein